MFPSSRQLCALAVLIGALACDREVAQVEAPALRGSSEPQQASAAPDGPRFYLGRQLAPTMTHEAAPWLIRPEREAEEKASVMIRELGLGAGDTACDVGAGNGYHALALAEVVGPKGRILAVDLQPEMLALLRSRAAEAKITNVETILATPADPRLPASACDVVLMVDVYHELSEPAAVLGHVRRALSDDGRLALVEFREEDPEVPIKPLHKMSKAQIHREMTANGFRLESEFDGLPWQHLMFFVPAERAVP